jgi:hypothetical protein
MAKKHVLTDEERSRGGKKAAAQPGGPCPLCGSDYPTHAALAGHLGLHAFADRYALGDLDHARRLLSLVGAAATDPYPENGAYSEGHSLLKKFRNRKKS